MVRRGLSSPLLLLLAFAFAVLARPRDARADPPGAHTVPVAVLAFDSEDAEEQADAITGALRSRIRAAQGWSLIETTQSLGMLTAALKCPSRPTPECQQKISEQLKAENYIWGFVSRGPVAGQVSAEIHLFQRGKPDAVLREAYADNLKDANDDTLRKIGARVVERLSGAAVGSLVVRAADATGDVILDGDKRVPLDKGVARLDVAAGSHSVEVAPTGGSPEKRNVLVVAGRETVVEFARAPAAAPVTISRAKLRTIVGGASVGVGVVLGGIAVYSLVHYLDLQSQGDEAAAKAAKTDPPRPCRESGDAECVRIDKAAKTASGLAWGLGAGSLLALGFGGYVLFGEPGASSSQAAPPGPRARVVPAVGVGSGGVVVVGAF
jgi:hypothetical protein